MRPTAFPTGLATPSLATALACPAFAQDQDPRKNATDATKAANATLLNELPFADRSDFENARRGSSPRCRRS